MWYIAGLLIVSSLFASVGGMAWLAWIKESVPQDIRLRFLARRHVFNTALAFSMSVGGGLLIDGWQRARPDSLLAFGACSPWHDVRAGGNPDSAPHS